MNYIEELTWRGMIHDVMPGTEEHLAKELTTAYLGIDPTADSLHIGHLVGIMLLKHFQLSGHKPIALVGGATGMIGDPSGKSEERNLLDEPTLRHNQECLKKQIAKFLDFDSDAPNVALMVNNYDWMKDFSFLEFIRDIGKHITVNYMMSKDSVKKRLSGEGEGMSFTEFTYQLVQGYDFLHLYKAHNCKLQIGGSDQWGNITTGTELIRRKANGEAFALTCPLITKPDGSKFGKSVKGNVWLDANRTSPYEFYQFWINVSDTEAERYIKIFTLLSRQEIDSIIEEHQKAPHLRLLQSRLAKEITCMVHSEEDYNVAVEASQILFGKASSDTISRIDENTFLSVFSGVPQFEVSRELIEKSILMNELLTVNTSIFPSKSELRRTVSGGGMSINQNKVTDYELVINAEYLLKGKYILVQKGKKQFYLILVK